MRIDVMMPAFNAARTIGAAIGSLQRQTHADLRILVVDDGSSDETPAVVAGLARRDGRILATRQENRGIVGARNAALALAETRFVAQLDADDLSEPDHIARLADHLDRHPGCVAVSGAARQINAEGRPLGAVSRFGPPAAADAALTPAREPVMMPFCLWRREALEAVGGYREVGIGEDCDLAWRLLGLGDATNIDAIVGSHRMHDSATGTALANGRSFAVCTQLVALSADRRRRGRPDLGFDAPGSARLRAAPTLDAMLETRGADLDGDEIAPLRMRVAAKLLQWCEWRGRLPEPHDVAFVRRAFARGPELPAAAGREVRRLRAVIGARLLRRGQVARATALLPGRLIPEACARTALGRY